MHALVAAAIAMITIGIPVACALQLLEEAAGTPAFLVASNAQLAHGWPCVGAGLDPVWPAHSTRTCAFPYGCRQSCRTLPGILGACALAACAAMASASCARAELRRRRLLLGRGPLLVCCTAGQGASGSQSWMDVDADGPVPDPEDQQHAGVWPLDKYNARLLDCVFPRVWHNPRREAGFVYDLVAVGAGAAGLVSAKQSARRGAQSALVEKHLSGGDCLNIGCVPSKAIIRSARAVAERRREDLGVDSVAAGGAGGAAFEQVMERMRRLRADIAPVDSHEETVRAGADVYVGRAVFVGPHALEVGGQTLRFRKAVVATGARAFVPPIPGLADVPYLTNSTLFNLTQLPPHLAILGAGAIGVEMAQAFQRLGSHVTLIQRSGRILQAEDGEAAAIIHAALAADGVQVLTDTAVESVRCSDSEAGAATDGADGAWPTISLVLRRRHAGSDTEATTCSCNALLVAIGRTPNVERLGLEAAGVEFTPGVGIHVNDDLSTSNQDIFAAGDVVDRPELRLTHAAGAMAGMAVQNALFAGRGMPVNAPSNVLSGLVMPRCTFTDPEVASCGVSSQEGQQGGLPVDTFTSSLGGNDKNILDSGAKEGFVRIVCKKGTDEMIGATIVADRAGEMLAELTLAIQHGLRLSDIARTIHPYPTMGEAVQQCALQFNRARWETMEKAQTH